MSSHFDIVLDNPILTKHARSRLRRNRVIPWSIVVVTLCGIICWAFYQLNGLTGTTPLTILITLQVVTLVFAGAGEIGGAVGGARESGVLDFHRVSPVPPLWLAVGFLLGAPLLQYWLTLLTVPFAILLAVVGPAGWLGLLAFELPLALSAGLLHTLTLSGSMISKKPKAGGGRGVIGLVVLGLFLGGSIFSGIQSAVFDMTGKMARLQFFGAEVPWVPLVVVYEVILIGFLLVPAVRRMRSDRAHLYTKPQAIAFLATLLFLTLGVTWTLPKFDGFVIGFLYVFVVIGIILASTFTPDRSEYIKGVRRALRSGHRRPSPWSDAGVNRVGLVLICGLVLLGATIAWEMIEGRGPDSPSAYSQTIAIAVLTIAYVGLGLQAAQLFMRKHGQTLFILFLFFAWLVPMIIGAALGGAGYENAAVVALASSPIAGIMLSTGLIEDALIGVSLDTARIASLVPAVGFTFLFQFLLELLQRKIDRAVRGSSPRVPDPFDDILGVPEKYVESELTDSAADRYRNPEPNRS